MILYKWVTDTKILFPDVGGTALFFLQFLLFFLSLIAVQMQMNKELYVRIEIDDPEWDNQLVFSRAYCNQAKLSILVSHARTYAVGSLNVTLIQPRIELPVMHWCDYSSIRQTLLIVQTPQSQPFLTCARVLQSWTTWELHLWESFPAAGLRRSALSRSIFPLLLMSPIQCHFHPCALLNVVFLSLPTGDKCPLWLNS